MTDKMMEVSQATYQELMDRMRTAHIELVTGQDVGRTHGMGSVQLLEDQQRVVGLWSWCIESETGSSRKRVWKHEVSVAMFEQFMPETGMCMACCGTGRAQQEIKQ